MDRVVWDMVWMSLADLAAGPGGRGRAPTRHIIAMFVDAVSYITHYYGRVSIVIRLDHRHGRQGASGLTYSGCGRRVRSENYWPHNFTIYRTHVRQVTANVP